MATAVFLFCSSACTIPNPDCCHEYNPICPSYCFQSDSGDDEGIKDDMLELADSMETDDMQASPDLLPAATDDMQASPDLARTHPDLQTAIDMTDCFGKPYPFSYCIKCVSEVCFCDANQMSWQCTL